MEEYVTDTMAIVLWLEKRKMPEKAKSVFKLLEDKKAILHIPGMAIVEVGYLYEKGRIDINISDVLSYLNSQDNVHFQPIDVNVIIATYEINDIPELHDRIIAATGRLLNFPVITNDPTIIASSFVGTIWK